MDDKRVQDCAPPAPPHCPGCHHAYPDPHDERDGGAWCLADVKAASDAGDDPRSVGPCY